MSGIEYIKQTANGIEVFCDCGAVTVLAGGDPGEVLTSGGGRSGEVIYVPAGGGEVAFTCPGCTSAHWLTFGQRQDGET